MDADDAVEETDRFLLRIVELVRIRLLVQTGRLGLVCGGSIRSRFAAGLGSLLEISGTAKREGSSQPRRLALRPGTLLVNSRQVLGSWAAHVGRRLLRSFA
ncbi:hypothetical protein HYQ46_000279 [Verticillium longisporum]|nr:hypothetical protein HYQ46_000279 [Verticillium longisporum]